jgi:hypothetical protein
MAQRGPDPAAEKDNQEAHQIPRNPLRPGAGQSVGRFAQSLSGFGALYAERASLQLRPNPL